MVLDLDKHEYELIRDKASQVDLIHKDEHLLLIHFHHIRFFQLIQHFLKNTPRKKNLYNIL